MRNHIIIFFILITTSTLAQKSVYLNVADKFKEITITEKVTIQEYLLTTNKLYGGMEVSTETGDTKTIHFTPSLAEDLMEKFPVGSRVNVEYGKTSIAYLSPNAFFFLDKRGIDFSDLPSSRSPFRINKLYLERESEYLSGLGKKELRARRVNGLIAAYNEGNRVELNRDKQVRKIRPKADELIEEVKIRKYKKVDRFNAVITLENGRELKLKRYQKNNLKNRNTFLVQYPWIFEGEVATEEFYEQPERVVPIYPFEVELVRPVYDNWSRLFAYEAIVDGDERLVKFETFHAQKVKAYADENMGRSQKFYMTKKQKRMVKDYEQGRYTGFTHRLTTLPENGELRILDDRFEDYEKQDTIQFKTKIKSIQQFKSYNQKWLQVYEDGIILENGYSINFGWKVSVSIKDQLEAGKEVEIVGIPYKPKEGEIYGLGVKQMLHVVSINIDGLSYKVSSE